MRRRSYRRLGTANISGQQGPLSKPSFGISDQAKARALGLELPNTHSTPKIKHNGFTGCEIITLDMGAKIPPYESPKPRRN